MKTIPNGVFFIRITYIEINYIYQANIVSSGYKCVLIKEFDKCVTNAYSVRTRCKRVRVIGIFFS